MTAPRQEPSQAGPSARRRLLARSSSAAATAAAVATLGCQAALTERNPASELIWWVSGAVFLVLAVILVVEVGDWLWLAWRRLRGHDRPPGPVRRTWGEGRTEADPEAER